MRVSDSQFNLLMTNAMMQNNVRLNKVAEQMASGDKINHLSDDPAATVKLQGLSKTISDNQQYQNNISNVQSSYDKYETYMNTLNEISMSVQDLLLQGKNGTLDAEMRNGIVTELESLKEEAITVLNTQHEGSYIFSGTKVDQPALVITTDDDGNSTYKLGGNDAHRHTNVGEGNSIQNNFTINDLMGSGSNFFVDLDAAIQEFKEPTDQFEETVSKALDTTQSTQVSVLNGIGILGSSYNTLDRMTQNSVDLELFATTVETGLMELDYAQASVEFQQSMIAMQAAQKTYVNISGNSLFDLL
ncbi:MAG: flagellar hook-associated protein FlgL [Vibrio sp.]